MSDQNYFFFQFCCLQLLQDTLLVHMAVGLLPHVLGLCELFRLLHFLVVLHHFFVPQFLTHSYLRIDHVLQFFLKVDVLVAFVLDSQLVLLLRFLRSERCP